MTSFRTRAFFCALTAAIVLAGCSSENKYEREADRITRAVMANDLGPVQKDISPQVQITRAQVAAASDELSQQGKLLSVKETTPCPAGDHCFTVKFQKHTYREMLRMDDQGKVVAWRFKMAPTSN
jgi:outer membrane murein-binding lipoprotein Lpp